MKVFGIDPGSARTGYGCVQTDGTRHKLVVCGAIASPASSPFPQKLKTIHTELALLLGLAQVPSPHDAADALAVAVCHVHAQPPARTLGAVQPSRSRATSWRTYKPSAAPAALPRGKTAGS